MTTKLAKFDFRQGFNRETTQYAEGQSWYDGNRVRFRADRPQNMRGYEVRTSTTFDGSARDLITWTDADSNARALFGTPDKLYEHDGDSIYDITPIQVYATLTACFGTSVGTTRVCCSDAAHGRAEGDYVYFTSTSAIGSSNVSLSGNVYPITSVVSGAVFTISVTGNAASTESAKGKATFNYYIPTGASVAAAGVGYTAASYNASDPTSVGISKISTTGSNTLVTVSCAAAHNGVANDTIIFIPSSVAAHPVTVGGNLILTRSSVGSVDVGGPEFTIVSIASTQVIISVNTAASATENATSNLAMTARIYPQVAGSIGTPYRAYDEPASASASGLVFKIAQWSLDNWGEDVIANRSGTNIFYFDSDASTTPVRATSITTSPISVNSIIVSPNDRHLIALGSNEYSATATVSGTFNPMLVRWSDQDDRTNWVPSVSSTSGEVVLTDGTQIVGGVRAKGAINIWTDNSLWLMEFVGPPFTFRFNQAGTNCGMIGPHAGVDYNGVTYWMGYDNFYRYTGQVEIIPCTVRRYIFNDINSSYYDKVYAGINAEFREIIWLYPSGSGTECDKYVIFNPEENYWVYGEMIFTTFAGTEVFGNTITTGVTASGNNIYNNEPVDVFTGSGETLVSYIESGDFDVADGNAIMFMNKIIPDYDLSGGKIKMKIITKEYPESTDSVTKEFDIYKTTQKVNFRSRGRQAKVRVSCASNNASWRWGSIRLGLQGDGSR
tara:strand:+ start:1474 stop:3648 length:2175 start_codon:yes stop_codon:yes gene_type:complete